MDATQACSRVHEIPETLPKWYGPSNGMLIKGIYVFYEEGEISSHRETRDRSGGNPTMQVVPQRPSLDPFALPWKLCATIFYATYFLLE